MAPRSSWKGFIRLSLVSIPVKAYTANATGSEIRLNQLHRDCNSPIKYRKVCPAHGELDAESIVSGYQYSKGQYVVIDPKEIEQLRTESDKAIAIDGFVERGAIDARYFAGKNHYLVPDGPVGQKAYVLLQRVMDEKGLHAIAQVVLSGKEQLVALRTVGRLLVMTGLSYESQVKRPDLFEDEVVDVDVSRDELKLTENLVDATTFAELDLAKYKDVYVEKLTQLIEAKVEGKEIVAAPDTEEPKVIELMEALKRSVADAAAQTPAGGTPAKKSKAKKKMAPSAGSKRQAAKKKRKTS